MLHFAMANKSAPWENQQCGRRFCALSGPLSGITKASASLYAHASARHGSIRPPRATIAAADDEVRPLAPVRNQRAARSHEGVDQSRPRLQKPSHVAVMPGPARFGGGRSEGPLAPGSWRLTRDWSSQGPLEEYPYFRLRLQSHQPSLKAGGMPTKKEAGTANATAAFHHVVAKGDIEKVKDFVLGGERKPGHPRVPVNSQDEDGLSAIHWAAMRGHKNVLKYLVETAPESNRADPKVVDKHGWSAILWAVFMVEQESKMTGEHAKRKQLCDVINYLIQTVPGSQELASNRDRLLYKSAVELANDAAIGTDEGVLAAIKGTWEPNKTYGHVNKDVEGNQ